MTNAELWAIKKGYNGLRERPGIFEVMEEYLKDTIDCYVVEAECLDCGSLYSRRLKLTQDGIEDERIF